MCSVSGHMQDTSFRLYIRTIVPRLARAGGHPSSPGVDKHFAIFQPGNPQPSLAQLLETSLGPDHFHRLASFFLEASWNPALLVTFVEACA